MEEKKKRSFGIRQIWALSPTAHIRFWSVAWDGVGVWSLGTAKGVQLPLCLHG